VAPEDADIMEDYVEEAKPTDRIEPIIIDHDVSEGDIVRKYPTAYKMRNNRTFLHWTRSQKRSFVGFGFNTNNNE
jgi:hypothetical protein